MNVPSFAPLSECSDLMVYQWYVSNKLDPSFKPVLMFRSCSNTISRHHHYTLILRAYLFVQAPRD